MRKLSRHLLLGTSLLATVLFSSACGKDDDDQPTTPTLYSRVGEVAGISRIVDGLVANIGAETALPTSVLYRSHADLLASTLPGSTDPGRLQRLRNHVVDQIGEASGGPVKYTGKSMVVSHTGMNITANEFAVWRVQFKKSLDTNNIGTTEQTELLRIMDNMQAQIVGQ